MRLCFGIATVVRLHYANGMIKQALIVLLALPGITHAVICKTIDSEGVVGYADAPASECRDQVKLPASSTYEPRRLPPSQPRSSVSGAVQPTTTARYESIQIEQPADKGTVRSNEGKVAVLIALEPPLQQTHRVTVYLDGKAVPGSFDGLAIELSGVDRGTHTLGAEVRNERDQRLIESSTISFTLRKETLDAEEPTQPIEPAPPGYDPDYTLPKPDYGAPGDPDYGSPAQPGYTPNGGGISSTPGRTNPAFAPKYTP